MARGYNSNVNINKRPDALSNRQIYALMYSSELRTTTNNVVVDATTNYTRKLAALANTPTLLYTTSSNYSYIVPLPCSLILFEHLSSVTIRPPLIYFYNKFPTSFCVIALHTMRACRYISL